MTTDYFTDRGCSKTYLEKIAEAGFTHVHWCHHWNTDFIYSACEISQVKKWLAEYGLKLLDLHGSVGPEKNWISSREYERLAGVELVKNRIEMVRRLSGNVVIMHAGEVAELTPLRKSLDALHLFARQRNIRIALENGDFEVIGTILSEYGSDFVGLCYDSGHGNQIPDGLDRLESFKDRLIAVHLHDNDGSSDQHNLPFSGTIDWGRLLEIIAASAYRKHVTLETLMINSGISSEKSFLTRAYAAGKKITEEWNGKSQESFSSGISRICACDLGSDNL